MDCGCGKQSLTNPETSCDNSKYQFSMAALRPTRSFPALPQQERSARVKTFEESEKVAKQNAGQPIENKHFREISDFAPQ